MPVAVMSRSASARLSSESKRPGSARSTWSGSRSQRSSRNASASTGERQRASAAPALAVAVVGVVGVRIVSVSVVGVRVLIVLVCIRELGPGRERPARQLVVGQRGAVVHLGLLVVGGSGVYFACFRRGRSGKRRLKFTRGPTLGRGVTLRLDPPSRLSGNLCRVCAGSGPAL